MDRGEYRRHACERCRGRESQSRTASSTGCSTATRRIALPSTLCEPKQTNKTDAFLLRSATSDQFIGSQILFYFFEFSIYWIVFISIFVCGKEAVEIERGELRALDWRWPGLSGSGECTRKCDCEWPRKRCEGCPDGQRAARGIYTRNVGFLLNVA